MPLFAEGSGEFARDVEQGLLCIGVFLVGVVGVIGLLLRSRIASAGSAVLAGLVTLLFQPWKAFWPKPSDDPNVVDWQDRYRRVAWWWVIVTSVAVAACLRAYWRRTPGSNNGASSRSMAPDPSLGLVLGCLFLLGVLGVGGCVLLKGPDPWRGTRASTGMGQTKSEAPGADLVAKGQRAFRDERYAAAEDAWQRALEAARMRGAGGKEVGDILFRMAVVASKLRRPDEAKSRAAEADGLWTQDRMSRQDRLTRRKELLAELGVTNDPAGQ
jgi:hypothetical protein